MRALLIVVLSILPFLSGAAPDVPGDYATLQTEAERYVAEGSYARAHELYARAAALQLPREEKRWVEFRLADTKWRAAAATSSPDETPLDDARKALEAVITALEQEDDRGRTWAEAQESLGDFWWSRERSRNQGGAWPYYEKALDWWAGSDQIDVARERYLRMIWKMSQPRWAERWGYWGSHGSIPRHLLQNAVKIAQTPTDRSRASYLLAMNVQNDVRDSADAERVKQLYEAALSQGTSAEWYDDALFQYGMYLERSGAVVTLPDDGGWRFESDFPKALGIYRRITSEFAKGETQYYDQAVDRIRQITAPALNLGVANVFLPGSEIEYVLGWRNVGTITLAIYKVDLTRDLAQSATRQDIISLLTPSGGAIRAWKHETTSNADHRPGSKRLSFEEPLPVGAYLIEATSGGEKAREIILVSDATVILKTAGDETIVYIANAIDGSPLTGSVNLRATWYDDGQRFRDFSASTDRNGIARISTASVSPHGLQLLATARSGERQAWAQSYAYGYGRGDARDMRAYVFTDRPAYRPGETAEWKMIVRQRTDEGYVTPAQQTIRYEITDPRGAKAKEGTLALNAFGSAAASLPLTAGMPLGEYRIGLRQGNNWIGGDTLFRLEEYKLPEYKVDVKTAEENGVRKAFRLGDTVEATIEASYYFGGPVANADVEVIVTQQPLYRHWWWPMEYSWYREIAPPRHYGGTEVLRERMKTDAAGRATVRFETPRDQSNDLEYRIEARVVDASRREITGTGTVRVTQLRYTVHARAKHNIYKPGDKVTVQFKALDANDQPVEAEGHVKITRERWREIWIDPQGREVGDRDLDAMRARSVFPPPESPGWRMKFRGFESEAIATERVKTDKNGEAELSFTPQRDGYYKFAWQSSDGGRRIAAETTVWVTAKNADFGYRHGAVEIIADRDSFKTGETAPVLIAANGNDRWVLFGVEGDRIYDMQLVHLDGPTKLVELTVAPEYVPNVFLTAAMVSDRQLATDVEPIAVPPVANFIDVTLTADKEQYQPREKGTLTLTARDHLGKPVAGEFALALTDESVFYIQSEYARDIRQFFFGDKRGHAVNTTSSFQARPYAKLVRREDGTIVDDRQAPRAREEKDEMAFDAMQEVSVGAAGGVARRQNMAEGISVTASAPAALEGAAMPPPAPPMAQKAMADQAAQGSVVVVRSDFRSTVLWKPDVVTDANGTAKIDATYPDSLTSWRATARGVSKGAQVGTASLTTRTKQPLMVRLQAPRFFVAGDKVTISAIVNNNTDDALTVAPELVAEGLTVEKRTGAAVSVPAGGEARADWSATADVPGLAKLTVTGRAGAYSDAMEKTFVVHEHGIEKFVAKSGKLRGGEAVVTLNLPAQRAGRSTTMTVQVAPSMAVTMLDALPYLIDYPYGCTEQTMSRFLPAAITARTLRARGISAETIETRIFGGIEREYASQTHSKPGAGARKLDDVIRQSLARLYDFQHGDGGWGWWKDGDSDHFMTAYVVWGMSIARDAGMEIRGNALDRAAAFLRQELVEEEENPELQAWMLHALAEYASTRGAAAPGQFEAKALDNAWKQRDELNAYGKSLLALAAHGFGRTEMAQTLVRNLENGVKIDTRPDTSILLKGEPGGAPEVIGTAHWGADGLWWRWVDGPVESTSMALRALLAIDPQNKLIEPVTNWLVKNRRGAQWSSTRDTAVAVLALNDYLTVSKELDSGSGYEVTVNGQTVASKTLTAAQTVAAPSRFAVDPKLIRDGENRIAIRRTSGSGALYFSVESEFFSTEEPVTPAGNEIFVKREYYRLAPKPTLLKGETFERKLMRDGDMVRSGERVEVVLTIEAKNDYEYLVFEDRKPAGLEAVALTSGGNAYARELKPSGATKRFGTGDRADVRRAMAPAETSDHYTGRTRWMHQELRDRHVAAFLDKLPEGIWEIRYELRAEVPGSFHAMPVSGYAMYVPEIRANGEEIRMTVEE
ncbi:MAG: alpha-2-macroglobulin family protein [Thermoanaerobaculia bacterium]